MQNDDVQVGRILSRRDALGLIGAGGAALLAVPAKTANAPARTLRLPACVVRPRQS